jgi:predicted nucleic acid-binding protein
VNYLLDTNVVSEWVKPQPNPNVVAWLAQAIENEIFISVRLDAKRKTTRPARSLAAERPAVSL